MAEYAVVLAVITPALVATLAFFSDEVANLINAVAGLL
jgi:Flp pilus assembly pilin Flp